jgi:quercetin dioxygenase-like cupin family protein
MPKKLDTSETLDVLGPSIQFLTPLSDGDDDYRLIRGTIPTGIAVRIHSHAERETFFVIEGEVQAFGEDHWIALSAGEGIDVPGGVKHAWRNVSSTSASVLVVAPMRLGRFLRDNGRPLAEVEPGTPKAADLQRLVEVAHTYGYRLGTPADNAAAGILLH